MYKNIACIVKRNKYIMCLIAGFSFFILSPFFTYSAALNFTFGMEWVIRRVGFLYVIGLESIFFLSRMEYVSRFCSGGMHNTSFIMHNVHIYSTFFPRENVDEEVFLFLVEKNASALYKHAEVYHSTRTDDDHLVCCYCFSAFATELYTLFFRGKKGTFIFYCG